jgi:methyltransferase (TIGR00027 family)
MHAQSQLMVARTVEIDEAIRADALPQLVILGAGLDGRAWRMSELKSATVFEVDHPDSQRDKRSRVAALGECAADVRFVPVDFTRDSLDEALTKAGHDPARPTMWIWEGVVMYLELRDIESTLSVIERRSAAGSRLSVSYHSPSPMLWVVGAGVRLLGEPLRSRFREHEMRDLLLRYRFRVIRDADIAKIGAELSSELGRDTRAMKHFRIATAERSA